MSLGYIAGKNGAKLQKPFSGMNLLYASNLFEGKEIDRGDYVGCTFANVSFKDSTIKNSRFSHCIFLNCYFRRTVFQNSAFDGCKFVDCDFPKTQILAASFLYTQFKGCFIPFREIHNSLPYEPNIRESIARNLAVQAEALGFREDSHAFHLVEIQAREEHFYAAASGDPSTYYRTKYGDFLSRLAAAIKYGWSRVNGFIWGYGEKWGVLLRNWVMIGLLIFPIVFWYTRTGLTKTVDLKFSDIIFFSISNMIPIFSISTVQATTIWVKTLSAFEGFVSILMAGLFIAIVLRGILRK
jgi:hypothetical protein